MSESGLSQHHAALGFTANPFPVTPDASRYFMSENMHIKLTELMHSISVRKGFMLVTADIGLGKTTLSRKIIQTLKDDDVEVALVLNSFLNGLDLLKAINDDFGLSTAGGMHHQLNVLNLMLMRLFKEGKNTVIMIDDAQNLTVESLDLLRQISNLETNEHKLVQILLIAQPEIVNTLNKPEIRQLRSRIALHIKLDPLSLKEVKEYVAFRFNSVGNKTGITLSAGAFKTLLNLSNGHPRKINLLMDRALYGVVFSGQPKISAALLKKASRDLYDVEAVKPDPQSKTGLLLAGLLTASALFAADRDLLAPALDALPHWSTPIVNMQPLANADPLPTQNGLDRYVAAPPVIDILTKTKQITVIAEEPVIDIQKAPVPVPVPAPAITQQDIATAVQKAMADAALANKIAVQKQQEALKEKIALFLSYHHLSKMTDDFKLALDSNDFSSLKEALLSKGLYLLVLADDSDRQLPLLHVKNKYDQSLWFAVWRAPYVIPEFYLDYEHRTISMLQDDLYRLGVYSAPTDGVVGRKTLQAVIEFQSRHGLKSDGVMTPMTHYLISKTVAMLG